MTTKEFVCKMCNKVFILKRTRKDRPSNFCSIGCSIKNLHSKDVVIKRAKAQTGLKRTEEFRKNRSGDKCHLWKGGITNTNFKIRNSLEIKLWKKACLERDNFTCQKTGVIGGKLVVHHINNFADFPQLRTSIENGITLSKESHIEFHKIYGKKNNNMKQLLEYINKK